jgi:fatty acid desaturase
MNLSYRREISRSALRSMKIWETVTFGAWACLLAAGWAGVLSWRALGIWYASTAIVSVINALRTLGAHDYQSEGAPLDRTKQLLDSIDTPGSFWTELWAPVGLRYHALHHYFPGIPYHNLAEAHRRLTGGLPANAPYRQTLSPGLWRSLRKLYSRGRNTRLQPIQSR